MKTAFATLAFFVKYDGWQSFSKTCVKTRRAVKTLARLGFLEVNEFSQARFTGKVFAN